MNRTVGNHFDGIDYTMKQYRLKTKEALQRYQAEKQKAEKSVEKFREDFKEEALAAAMEKPIASAKAEIRQAGKEYQSEMRRYISALQGELENHLSAPMDANFVQQLRLYRELNIPPTKTEAKMLLKMNAGNTLGIRALASVLEQTGAKVRLKYRNPDEFSQDLERIERVAAAACNPVFDVSDASTALELYRGDSWLSVRPDGSTYDAGEKTDFIHISLDNANFEALQKALGKMRDNWKADISYKLEDIVDMVLTEKEWEQEAAAAKAEGREPQPLEQPASTTQFEGEGMALAREIGQETAKAAQAGAGAFIKQYAR